MGRKFLGYRRENGTVGVRNYVAIIPSVFCANRTAELIARRAGDDGIIALHHPVGCTQVGFDFELTARTLIAMGRHPNIAAVLVVGLGCERFRPEELYEGIKASKKPVEKLVIQEVGDAFQTIEKGVLIVKEMKKYADSLKREECGLDELTVALKCGGTDATSGLAANPSVGEMSDLLVKEGGSTILSELNELLGTEDILARRAVSGEVAEKIRRSVATIEEVLRSGCDLRFPGRNELISPGNFDGGVSSVVEKALGGVHKSGTAPIVDVLDYAVPPKEKKAGVYMMEYESQDGEVVTGMVGCGAQIAAFTTGRGTPTGFPFVPVIKITGNDYCYNRMKANIDFHAGEIISGEASIEEKGKELFELVVKVAEGEATKAEQMGADDLFCIARRK
ncbi:UxaA family hydrolase [Clostridium sp. AM58-1XD]|uniref:UxaA family hydrolase n=1 Tax=Clostridium sp. AM58-1XD TaxID=2292307 RepID=UPI000E51A301|nr:UxaA family hydrolase [Clostridium sp. AM58-1XD]RGY98369.1 galactonate dehydratase [Clostridium sp. AM58-1XD]